MNLGIRLLSLFRAHDARRLVVATSAMSVIALVALGGTAKANLVQNGNFETTPGIFTSTEINTTGNLAYWSSSQSSPFGNHSYNFVYFPGFVTPSDPHGAYDTANPTQDQCAAGTPGANTGPAGYVCLYGTGPNGSGSFPLSRPNGGNFVALDADPNYAAALTQSVSGLIPTKTYTLTFDWGGAQYTTVQGPTTEQLGVTLGSQTLYTPVIDNASASFTGWRPDTMTFTATNTTEVLSFLAIGTPGNGPPVAVLDNVSLTPEPSYWMVMVLGLGLLLVAARKRFKSTSQSV